MAVAAPVRPVLYKREEAAQYLGVSVQALDLWVKRGALHPIRLGRLVRFRLEELERVTREGIA